MPLKHSLKLIEALPNNRNPKTTHFCVRCRKDLKPGQPFRQVHCVNGGYYVLHPEDEAQYVSDGGDMGGFSLGMDCARRIGLEWTHPNPEATKSKP